ncbi:MAG: hypothetical protein AAFR76_13565 [Planctomycetota bacterium]
MVADGENYLVLAGFCFDSDRPGTSLAAIASRLALQPIEDLVDATASFVGRWVIISRRVSTHIAFHDAAGVYPVVHMGRGSDAVLASSSKLIEAISPGHAPSELIDERFAELQRRPGLHAGQSFPLRLTSFADVFALLPNHRLDISTGEQHRYFPAVAMPGDQRAVELAPVIAKRFLRIIRSIASNRGLALAATGGYDSRMIQAAIHATPGIASSIRCFTFQYPHDPDAQDSDLVAMKRLATLTGVSFRVIPAAADDPGDAIKQVARASEEFFATGFEGWAEQAASEFGDGTLILMGWASEIARGFYRWPGSDCVTPNDLAGCTGVASIPEFIPEFERWLVDANRASTLSGVPVLDLFYWENRVGRWCSGGLNILNTAADWITPFSCRDLLSTMLRVREADRAGGEQALYREVVRQLRPELLSVPINPVSLRKRARRGLIHSLQRTKQVVNSLVKNQG